MANNLLVRIDTTHVPDGQVIYWKIAHATTDASDFENTSGTAVIYNNSAEFYIRAVADEFWENSESFQVEIYDGPNADSNLLTIGPVIELLNSNVQPTVLVQPVSNTVVEGSAVEVNIAASQASEGTPLYWVIKHISTSDEDFTKTTGVAVISQGGATVSINIPADVYAESDKEFEIEIRSGSPTGPLLSTSSPIKVTAETTAPVYKLSATPTEAKEGSTFYFNVSGTNIPEGTMLYWVVNHTTTTDSNFIQVRGTTVVNKNASGFAIDTVVNPDYTADKTFTLSLHKGSYNGEILGTTQALTLKNSSVLSYKAEVDKRSVEEDGEFAVTVTTTGVPTGSPLYWFVRHGNTDASDFMSTSGMVTVVNNKAVFTVRTLTDFANESGEAFQIEVKSGSASGPTVATLSSLTISNVAPTASYSFLPKDVALDENGNIPVDEGSDLVLQLSGTSNPWLGTLYWEIEHIGTHDSDFPATSGSVAMPVTGEATLSIPINTDVYFTGDKTFKVNFYADAGKTNLLGTGPTVKVIDKTTPQFNISAHGETLTEGGVVNVQITAGNVPDNTVLYWAVLHDTTSDEDFDRVTGTAIVQSGVARFSINTFTDEVWDTDETFRFEVRVGGSSGQVVAVSQTIKLKEAHLNMYTACCIFEPGVSVDARSLFVLGRK